MNTFLKTTRPKLQQAILAAICIALTACGGGSSGGSVGGAGTEGTTSNRIDRSSFRTEGSQVDTATGFRSEGNVVFTHHDYSMLLENAMLDVDVNDEGTVVDMRGTTNVPTNLSTDVLIEANVKSIVDMMTGAEANMIDEIDIWLQEDRRYLIYYVGSEFKIIHTGIDGVEGSTVTLKPPLGGSILIISDPTDPFFYTSAAADIIGGYGSGDSYNGLIPYVPDLPYSELDMFDGHDIERVTDFGIGVKAFDVMSVTGTKVILSDNKTAVNLAEALDPLQDYKAGFNGSAKIDLKVFGVGFFSFDVGQLSATIDVNDDHQQMAMQTVLEPDVSWAPSWLPIVPSSRTQGEWMVNGDGRFEANLESSYSSTLPKADLFGSMELNNEGATFTGRDNSGAEPLGIKAMFRNDVTSVEVELHADFDLGLEDGVLDALDRELATITEWTDKLKQRTADYELEVSLRGIRQSLPAIADNAITTLRAVPGKIRTEVDSSIVRTINLHPVLGPALNKDTTNSIADGYADAERNRAQTEVNKIIPIMENLKFQALQADDQSLRAALKKALHDAYARRTYSQAINVKRTILGKEYTLYNKTETHTIIPSDKASKIKEAANNAHLIQETSDRKIEAETIVGDLREEEIVNKARAKVESGLARIPGLDGLGYSVFQDTYEPYIVLDGTSYSTEVNMLDKSALYEAVYDKMAELIE